MNTIRYLVATFLLVFSGQSLALFMPDGYKVSTDNTMVPQDGCGHGTVLKVSSAQ